MRLWEVVMHAWSVLAEWSTEERCTTRSLREQALAEKSIPARISLLSSWGWVSGTGGQTIRVFAHFVFLDVGCRLGTRM